MEREVKVKKLEHLGRMVSEVNDLATREAGNLEALRERLLCERASATSAGLPGRPAWGWRGWGVAIAVFLLACGALLVWSAHRHAPEHHPGLTFTLAGEANGRGRALPAHPGQALVARETAPLFIRFSDGSAVRLERRGAARVKRVDRRGAVLRLERGRARVEIRPLPRARWVFRAGPYEVRVIGTAFELSWEPTGGAFTLAVSHGRVAARWPNLERREVAAGETVRATAAPPPPPTAGSEPPAPQGPVASPPTPGLSSSAMEPLSPATRLDRPRVARRRLERKRAPLAGAAETASTQVGLAPPAVASAVAPGRPAATWAPPPTGTWTPSPPAARPLAGPGAFDDLGQTSKAEHKAQQHEAQQHKAQQHKGQPNPGAPRRDAQGQVSKPARAVPAERLGSSRRVVTGLYHLVAANRFRAALRAARDAGWTTVLSSAPAELLLELGDAARIVRDPDTEEIYRTIRARFPGHRASASAAYALGQIALDERGAAREAADWFAEYLRQLPSGPLAREAQGRLIESRQRAGDRAGARLAARAYLRRYPGGPHAGLARRVLGRNEPSGRGPKR